MRRASSEFGLGCHTPCVMRKLSVIPIVVLAVLVLGMFLFLPFLDSTAFPSRIHSIEFVKFTTNSGTREATFRFRNHFRWPADIETSIVYSPTNDPYHSLHTEYRPLSLPAPLASGSTCTFCVEVPPATGMWEVLVRANKTEITAADMRHVQIRYWFQSHGMNFIGDRMWTKDFVHNLTPGPKMNFNGLERD